MDQDAAAETYRRSSFENAPPVKVVRMLYEGALRFLERAEKAAGGSEAREWLRRVEMIVNELRCSLDHEAAPEVSANLEVLYLFVEERLARAALQADASAIGEARGVLETLLDGWSGAQVELDGLSRTATDEAA